MQLVYLLSIIQRLRLPEYYNITFRRYNDPHILLTKIHFISTILIIY